MTPSETPLPNLPDSHLPEFDLPESDLPDSDLPASSLDDAARWVVRLQTGDLDKTQQGALKAWLDRSPEHAAALDLAKRAWGGLGQAAVKSAVRAAATPASDASRAVQSRPVRPIRRPVVRTGWLWAGGAALAACAGVIWFIQPVETVYRVAPDHRASVQLSDGTQIGLAGDTELHVRMSPFSRSAVLVRGQGDFAVVHDANKPFSVRARSIEVRDIGTRFVVRDRGDAEYVRLIEGRVALVAPATGHMLGELAPGQEARIDGGPARPVVTAATSVLPPTDGRGDHVRLHDTPLRTALKAFEWREGVDIVLRDPSLADIRVSGVYRTDDTVSFLNALARIEPIRWRAVSPGRFEVIQRN